MTVARPPRKTRFRLLARLCRTGLVTRRVPIKGFTLLAILLFRASCARSDLVPILLSPSFHLHGGTGGSRGSDLVPILLSPSFHLHEGTGRRKRETLRFCTSRSRCPGGHAVQGVRPSSNSFKPIVPPSRGDRTAETGDIALLHVPIALGANGTIASGTVASLTTEVYSDSRSFRIIQGVRPSSNFERRGGDRVIILKMEGATTGMPSTNKPKAKGSRGCNARPDYPGAQP